MLAVYAAAGIAGCGNDPVDIEEHAEPEGVVLELNAVTIAE